jgi:PhnB protein
MSNLQNIHPYIALHGVAAEAIELYTRVLGAKAESVMYWRDMPGGDVPENQKNKVMHSELTLDGRTILSVADGHFPENSGPATSNIQVCLSFTDPDALHQAFAGLSEGGTVVMAVHDSFWGAKFGMLTDRYGVRWMFNCPTEPKA